MEPNKPSSIDAISQDFSLNSIKNKTAPSFTFHIFICQNERPPDSKIGCCASKNSLNLINYMKGRVKELGLRNIRINKSGCLGQCSNGPALVIYPQGKWFQIKNNEDIETILEKYISPIGPSVTERAFRDHLIPSNSR